MSDPENTLLQTIQQIQKNPETTWLYFGQTQNCSKEFAEVPRYAISTTS